MSLRLFASLTVLVVLATAVIPPADSRGFRRAQRIMTPDLLTEGRDASGLGELQGVALDGPIPIPRPDVKQAMETIFARWGTAETRLAFNENFVNSSRLSDLILDLAPRSYRLRVLQVSNIEVLTQAIRPGAAPGGQDLLVSRVAATVTTQLEFTDRVNRRFRRLRGVNDYVIQMFHKVQREGDR